MIVGGFSEGPFDAATAVPPIIEVIMIAGKPSANRSLLV
jgi:hypothetical protein